MSEQIDVRDQATGNIPLASKNVLLVTCMDLRLLDDVVHFMDGENLTNRYDQVISAGASLSLGRPRTAGPDTFASCRHAFYDHLELAVALHQIKYLYVIEHADCGAYKYVGGAGGERARAAKPPSEVEMQEKCLRRFLDDIDEYIGLKQADPCGVPIGAAVPGGVPFRMPGSEAAAGDLTRVIGTIYDDRYLRPPHARDWTLKCYGFRMDLRGQVQLISAPDDHRSPTARAETAKARPRPRRRDGGSRS